MYYNYFLIASEYVYNVEVTHKATPSRDKCDSLDYPKDISAQDLQDLTSNNQDKIVVTVWLENYQGNEKQNQVNKDVTKAVWKMICENHPNVLYSQADLSSYNRNAHTFDFSSSEIGVDRTSLYTGPVVMITFKGLAMTYTSDKFNPSLLKAVDLYLHKWEKNLYGTSNPQCDVKSKLFIVKLLGVLIKDFNSFKYFQFLSNTSHKHLLILYLNYHL